MNQEINELSFEEISIISGGSEIDPPQSTAACIYPEIENDPPAV